MRPVSVGRSSAARAILDGAIRTTLAVAGGSAAVGRLTILIFHRVLPEPDPLFPGEMHRDRFQRTCEWIARWFNVLPLDQAVRRLKERDLPPRALSITFDDGYADNLQVATPILRRSGLEATFFIATGFLDGGRMFNDSIIESIRRTTSDSMDLSVLGLDGIARLPLRTTADRRKSIEAIIRAVKYLPHEDRQRAVDGLARVAGVRLPDDLMMTRGQVRALLDFGMQVGAHTRNHPILARLNYEQAVAEIRMGKAELEVVVDRNVALFAYPNGQPSIDYTQETIAAVRAVRFDAAVTTAWGAATTDGDLFQLPRFTPWDRGAAAFALRAARNLRLAPAYVPN